MSIRALTFLSLICLVGALTGCGLSKDRGAESRHLVSAVSCGGALFAKSAHPLLVQSCNNCHAGGEGPGGFALPDAGTAYPGAASRTNFGNPNQSLLYVKSSQAGHGNGNCTMCGNQGFAASLSSAIAEWAQGEAGTHPLCATLKGVGGEMPTNGLPSFDGSGSDAVGGSVLPEVPVSATGLVEFKAKVHPILLNNCIQCHAPGRVMASVPLAADDSVLSYKTTKLRASLSNLSASLVLNNAKTPNHGNGCVNCGPALETTLHTALTDWQVAENAAAPPRIALSMKDIPAFNANPAIPVTMIWALPAEMLAPNMELNGTFFQVRIKRLLDDVGNIYYDIYDPILITQGASSLIYVNEVLPVFNGTEMASATGFKSIDFSVPAGRTLSTTPPAPILSKGHLVLRKSATGVDRLSFTFKILGRN